jgi:hypothetical protein
MKDLLFVGSLFLLAGVLSAQGGVALHNVEVGGAGLFPVSGYKTNAYSPGFGWRPGYELRFLRPLGAEAGFTEAWLRGTQCTRSGCDHPREPLKLMDYGLRGHILLDDDRIDLSAGVGGGYIWYRYGDRFTNGSLIQYSGKAAVAIDHGKRVHAAFTLRIWRDLGRPTQQWLSPTGSVIFALGRLP